MSKKKSKRVVDEYDPEQPGHPTMRRQKPRKPPALMYVVICDRCPVFANASFDRCVARISALMQSQVDNPCDSAVYVSFSIMRVEAE